MLHSRDGFRVTSILVRRDRARVHRMGLGQGVTKEPLRCGGIPLGGQQKVNRLTGFIDRPIKVRLMTLHLYIGFINPPRTIGWSQMRPDTLLQLRGVSLSPAKNRRVLHRYPAVLKHQFKVTVADRKH